MPYLTESLPLSEQVFILLRDLIQERLGLYYGPEKREILQDRLAPLVTEQNLGSFLDYYFLLKYQEDRQNEWYRVQTALAVRETFFWREVDQVTLAARELVPALRRRFPLRPVRIWHAACATGEEPYSMAMALHESGGFLGGPVEIVASDFDQEALRMAREGLYRERSFRALPPGLRLKYFFSHFNGLSRLDDLIRSRVQFNYLNLVDQAGIAAMKNFDMIFCRNVFIYFNDSTIQQVANQFYQALRSPGYLFLGAAESLLRVRTRFHLVEIAGCFVYCKDDSNL